MIRPAAVVLCGGESRRMGRCKADLRLGDETFLERIVRLVALECDPVVVVAAADQRLPALPTATILVRDETCGLGPLHALGAGMDALPSGSERFYATGVDSPLLHPCWIPLLDRRIGTHDAIVPLVDGRWQPLSALYRVSPTRGGVARSRSGGRSSLIGLLDGLGIQPAASAELRRIDPSLATLRNINDPEAYRRLLDDFASAATQARSSPGTSS